MVAFWGVIRDSQSNINIYYSPSLQLPTSNWCSAWQLAMQAGTWERAAPNNIVCTVPQYVRHHKLPPPRVLHVWYRPGQDTWRVGSNVYVWTFFGAYSAPHYIFYFFTFYSWFCLNLGFCEKICWLGHYWRRYVCSTLSETKQNRL